MKLSKSISYLIILAIGIICTWIILNRGLYKRVGPGGWGVVIHDINYYYGYLPATFIEHDPSLKFLDDTSRAQEFAGRYWHLDAPNGGHVFKMSMGMSYLYTPFFLAGHAAAVIKNKPTDGYSRPYQFFMSLSGLFYMLLGLWFLRKTLLRYFSEWVSLFTLVILGLGTNLYFYSVQEGPMTHAPNFFLFSLILYLTIRWHEQASWGQSLLLGLAIGVASLIRPTNVLIALVPFLYNVYSIHSVRGKWQWMLTYYQKLIAIGLCILLPWVPQLLYWKMITGQWFYYSYGTESFFFSNPHILETLFSFRKGLFIYTPLMLVAFAGLFILRKRLPQFSTSIWLFTAANIYVISSWWCWWYGGSFGLRAYIEMFALWAIPLAVIIEKVLSYRKLIRAGIVSVMLLLVLLNIFQSMEYWNGAIHWDGMNYKLYKAQFLRRGCAPGYEQMVTPPDYEKAMKGEKEFYWK
jgi:hypothetical protein